MKSTRVHRGEKKFGEHKKKLIAFLVAFFFAIRSVYYEYFSSVIVVDSFSLSALRRRGPTKKRIKIIKRTAKSVYKKYNRLVLRLLQLFMCYVFDYRSWFLCFCRCCCSSLRRWLITMQKMSMKTDSLLVVFIVDWQNKRRLRSSQSVCPIHDRYDDNSVKSRSLNLIFMFFARVLARQRHRRESGERNLWVELHMFGSFCFFVLKNNREKFNQGNTREFIQTSSMSILCFIYQAEKLLCTLLAFELRHYANMRRRLWIN